MRTDASFFSHTTGEIQVTRSLFKFSFRMLFHRLAIVFCCYSIIVVSDAWNWNDDGNVRWSYNCDFYGDGEMDVDNQIDVDSIIVVKLIGQYETNSQDCAGLCWTDFNCLYYSYTTLNSCRTMALKKNLIQLSSASIGKENGRRVISRRLTTPFLADGDETICGYIPSRINAIKMSIN
jgi:hypothetical protein